MGVNRGSKNLKEKYENLKRKARKPLAEERRELYKTGGGQYRSYTDPNTERLAALMGQSATGFSNSYDSDEKVARDETIPEILEESMRSCDQQPIIEAVEAVETTNVTDWSVWNPAWLKKKVSHKVAPQRERQKPANDGQQNFWEEGNKRSAERHQRAKEKHEAEMELLRLEIQLKRAKLNVE